MPQLAKNRVLFTFLITGSILLITIIAIFWARGFKPNFQDGSIERTGLVVITSEPTGANVYLDDRLTSATNTNIAFLDPKTYNIRIEKDGYTPWQKEIQQLQAIYFRRFLKTLMIQKFPRSQRCLAHPRQAGIIV